MKTDVKELIKAERKYSRFSFISDFIQDGRKKPKKYKHYIKLPSFLFQELEDKGVIDSQDYYIDQSAFFEFSEFTVTISFINLFSREDLQRKIYHHLVVKFAGSDPLEIGGIFF